MIATGSAPLLVGVLLLNLHVPACASQPGAPSTEWGRIEKEIAFFRANGIPDRLHAEALNPQALILPDDKDPLDVLLRRTSALLDHLTRDNNRAFWESAAHSLDSFRSREGVLKLDQSIDRQRLFTELHAFRRRIALRNPLLDFEDILFLTHHRQGRGEVHMVDQYEGHNARPGGGLFALRDAFTGSPRVENVLAGKQVANGRLRGQELVDGSFISLELDFDAKVAYFAWTQAKDVPADASWEGQFWTREEAVADGKGHYYWSPETCYHLFRIELDSGRLIQLTDGRWNDFDPCVLPNGRLAFISERRGGFLRCGARPNPTFTLHGMMPDGSDIIPLSSHETHEWHPSVGHDGRIVYSRWDYVDRDSDIAHHPWVCFADGRDPRALHGNYPEIRENRPWMELSIRAVPGSSSLVAVAAPHHGENYGSVILVDPRVEDDGAGSQLKRVTPEVHFPESEISPGIPGPAHKGGDRGGLVYGQPWPLSKDFHLVVYDPSEKHYGIYLLDSFGNKIHLYTDPEVPCLDPMPFSPRRRPPVVPSRTTQALADRGEGTPTTTTAAVMDVYDSALPWPEGTRISALRVVQVFPKTTRVAHKPKMGIGDQSLGRGLLGVVPVEQDGSAYFELPADVPVYFQALDEAGRAVQTMRSVTYAHRGEHLVCHGCHEARLRSPARPASSKTVQAMRRAPSKLNRKTDGSWPLSFARLIQPIVRQRCADCHEKEPDAPGLSERIVDHGWTEAYRTLGARAWAKHGGNGALARNRTSYSLPGKVGARASSLLAILEGDHHGLELTDEELDRFVLWLDLNSNFYGVYHALPAQADGELVAPILQ